MTFQGHGRRTILLIVVVTFFILAWFVLSQQHNEKFAADKWKSWRETEFTLSLRWDMVDDLQRNYSLVGMSKSQIFDLLGPPSSVSGAELFYYLGLARKGINTGRLTITFGDDEAVSEVSVWDG